jgi:hypothetical protein
MVSILLKRSFFVIDTDCLSFFGNNTGVLNYPIPSWWLRRGHPVD